MINDFDIKKLCGDSNLILPFDIDLLNSHSYDCRLSNRLKRLENNGNWEEEEIIFSKFAKTYLRPHEFALGSTIETLSLPPFVAGAVQGKSSIGRTGLQIECAGVIFPEFHGQITLELYNMTNHLIYLEPGMKICQILFNLVTRAQIKNYSKFGNYNDQIGPTVSNQNRIFTPVLKVESTSNEIKNLDFIYKNPICD